MREFNSYAGSKPDIFVGGPGGVFDSGDYVGHLDNLVNRQGWMEEFSDTCGKLWWPVVGSYGYTSIAFAPEAMDNEAIRDRLDGLDHYPIMDEIGSVSLDIRQEAEDRAWEDYGRDEFRQWLRKEYTEEIVETFDDRLLDEVWWEAVHAGRGEEVEFEHLTAVFNFDRAFERRDLDRALGVVDWPEALRKYLTSMFGYSPSGGHVSQLVPRVDELPLEVMEDFFKYLVEKSPDVELNTYDTGGTIAELIAPVQRWDENHWLVFLDLLEEENFKFNARVKRFIEAKKR